MAGMQLAQRIEAASSSLRSLIEELPATVRPSTEAVDGFYDWGDKGDDAPPWSDWSDKDSY